MTSSGTTVGIGRWTIDPRLAGDGARLPVLVAPPEGSRVVPRSEMRCRTLLRLWVRDWEKRSTLPWPSFIHCRYYSLISMLLSKSKNMPLIFSLYVVFSSRCEQPMPAMAPIWEQHMAANTGETFNHGTGIKLYISNLDYGVSNDDLMVPQSSLLPLLLLWSSWRADPYLIYWWPINCTCEMNGWMGTTIASGRFCTSEVVRFIPMADKELIVIFFYFFFIWLHFLKFVTWRFV